MRVSLFTRWPEAGKAKTRLIPALGAQGAADLHRRLTERTVGVVQAAGLALEVRSTGADVGQFRAWLGAETVVDQGAGDLGMRLARAAAALPVLLLGADIPGLTPEHLILAVEALRKAPAVVGPAADGGYWVLGLSQAVPGVFDGIAWGTSGVLAATLARLPAETVRLTTLSDLDTPDDLLCWPDI
ncbi:MAG: TIGR04282 family arsenosugar biosynthesis glycosyltransferase [Sandarakinorhabdus sp.]|nr:TIGR04282 family arsenosugar biosynthesis glycosyltransferase [Sandarakinorhabdus sp.]